MSAALQACFTAVAMATTSSRCLKSSARSSKKRSSSINSRASPCHHQRPAATTPTNCKTWPEPDTAGDQDAAAPTRLQSDGRSHPPTLGWSGHLVPGSRSDSMYRLTRPLTSQLASPRDNHPLRCFATDHRNPCPRGRAWTKRARNSSIWPFKHVVTPLRLRISKSLCGPQSLATFGRNDSLHRTQQPSRPMCGGKVSKTASPFRTINHAGRLPLRDSL
jgi:hypothetical protein